MLADSIARLIEEMQSRFTQEEVVDATPVFEPVETNDYNYDLDETPTPSFSFDEQSYNPIEEVREPEITESAVEEALSETDDEKPEQSEDFFNELAVEETVEETEIQPDPRLR